MFFRLINSSNTWIVLLAVLQSLFALLFYLDGVYADQWDFIPRLERAQNADDGLAVFFGLHVSHLHTSAHLIMWFLATLSQWNIFWEAVAIVVFNLLSFLILYQVVLKPLLLETGNIARAFIILIALIYFSLVHSINLIWTWQLAVHTAIFGMMLALWAFSRPTINGGNVFIAIFGALFACFSFATSFAIWPIGLYLLMRHATLTKSRLYLYSGLWVFASICMGWYYYSLMSQHSSPEVHIDAVKFALFILSALGMSVSYFSKDFSIVVSCAGIGLACYLVFYLYKKHPATIKESTFKLALCFMMLGLISVIMIAMGRVELGLDQARSARYIIFSQFFWIGLIVLIIHYLKARRTLMLLKPIRYTLFFILLLVSASYLKGANEGVDLYHDYNQIVYTPFIQAESSQRDQVLANALLEFFPHYPAKNELERRLQFLKTHRLNFYRE